MQCLSEKYAKIIRSCRYIVNQHIFNTRQQAEDITGSTGLILLLLQQLTKSFSLS